MPCGAAPSRSRTPTVGELPYVLVELVHEALAEAHDLGVALALGVEVGAAFAAAREPSELRAETADLLDQLRLLSEMEQFDVKNIL